MSRRRGPSLKVCIFADACDLEVAQRVLHELPADAYGQLYFAGERAAALEAPVRVQVNRVQSNSSLCPLADAMTGWAAEWLPEGADSETDGPTVWVLPGATVALSAADHECVTRLITALPSHQLIHG